MRVDDALLTLNDRCGQEVEAYVRVPEPGEHPRIIVSAVGTLQHWSEDPVKDPSSLAVRESWRGAYRVGDMHLNVTSLVDDVTVDVDVDGHPWAYTFPLEGGVELLIVWQPERPLPPLG
jgi:hypothetical protein